MQIGPRALGQVLADAMNALARVWKPLAITALAVFIPVGVITMVVFRVTGATDFLNVVFNDPDLIETLTQEEFFEIARPFLFAVGIALAIQTMASIFVYLATAHVMAVDAAGQRASGAEARRHALRRYGVAIIATLIALIVIVIVFGVGLAVWLVPVTLVGTPNATSALIAFVLLVALAGPGVWLSVGLSMFVAVVAVEPHGPINALRRSFNLVKGRWWQTFGFLLLVGLLGFVAIQLIQLVAIPLAGVGSLEGGVSLASVLGVVAQGLIVAGYGAMYAVWYIDLRARKEQLSADDLS